MLDGNRPWPQPGSAAIIDGSGQSWAERCEPLSRPCRPPARGFPGRWRESDVLYFPDLASDCNQRGGQKRCRRGVSGARRILERRNDLGIVVQFYAAAGKIGAADERAIFEDDLLAGWRWSCPREIGRLDKRAPNADSEGGRERAVADECDRAEQVEMRHAARRGKRAHVSMHLMIVAQACSGRHFVQRNSRMQRPPTDIFDINDGELSPGDPDGIWRAFDRQTLEREDDVIL